MTDHIPTAKPENIPMIKNVGEVWKNKSTCLPTHIPASNKTANSTPITPTTAIAFHGLGVESGEELELFALPISSDLLFLFLTIVYILTKFTEYSFN